MKNIFYKIINLIYENSCLICSKGTECLRVCQTCESSFVIRKINSIKTFDEITILSWGFYDGQLREGILKLKSGKRKLANYFGKKLRDFWREPPNKSRFKDCLVIPVPSHNKRVQERGYCQTTLLVKDFALNLNMNYSSKLVKRIKETAYMNSLNTISDRALNIKDAFEINDNKVEEKNILIIDDILTSGSTMCELAKTIHKKYPEINLMGLTIASGDKHNLSDN